MPITNMHSEAFFVLRAEGKKTLDGMRKIVSAVTASILLEFREFISDAC
jgi:hypothetical protein